MVGPTQKRGVGVRLNAKDAESCCAEATQDSRHKCAEVEEAGGQVRRRRVAGIGKEHGRWTEAQRRSDQGTRGVRFCRNGGEFRRQGRRFVWSGLFFDGDGVSGLEGGAVDHEAGEGQGSRAGLEGLGKFGAAELGDEMAAGVGLGECSRDSLQGD